MHCSAGVFFWGFSGRMVNSGMWAQFQISTFVVEYRGEFGG